jgi:hypothetical protein
MTLKIFKTLSKRRMCNWFVMSGLSRVNNKNQKKLESLLCLHLILQKQA